MLRIHPSVVSTIAGSTSWARWSGASDLDVEHELHALRGELGDRDEVGDRRVVDEDVDRCPPSTTASATRRSRSSGIRDVRGDRRPRCRPQRGSARRSRGSCPRAGSSRVHRSRGDDDRRARAAEALGDRRADAPARPCHDPHAALERSVGHLPPPWSVTASFIAHPSSGDVSRRRQRTKRTRRPSNRENGVDLRQPRRRMAEVMAALRPRTLVRRSSGRRRRPSRRPPTSSATWNRHCPWARFPIST